MRVKNIPSLPRVAMNQDDLPITVLAAATVAVSAMGLPSRVGAFRERAKGQLAVGLPGHGRTVFGGYPDVVR
jgi:hypothetical protein